MEEKDEKEKFSYLMDTVTAEREIFISDTHKQAMAMEGDDINSVDTRLTKNQAPVKLNESDSLSEITGETRESKAKAYAVQETKKVSLQYIDTIAQLNGNHQNEMGEMQEKLAAIMRELELAKKDKGKGIKDKEKDGMEGESDLSESNHDEDDREMIDDEEGDDDLSGITSSSSTNTNNEDEDDSVTIISGKGKPRPETNGNETSASPFRKKRDNKNTYDFDLAEATGDGANKIPKVTPKKKPTRLSLRLTPPPLANDSGRVVL